MLSFSIAEDSQKIQNSLKKFVDIHHAFSLVSIDSDRLPRKWYGGGKMFEKPLYIGAFNHFPISKFLEFLRHDIKWEYPEDVELFELTGDAERFTVHYIA